MAPTSGTAAGAQFRQRLDAAIKARGMSKAELAREIGVSRQSVSNWVAGSNEPNLNQLRKLSKALRVSASYLVGDGADEDLAGDAAALELATKIGSLRLGRAIRAINASHPDLLDLLVEAERLVDQRRASRAGR